MMIVSKLNGDLFFINSGPNLKTKYKYNPKIHIMGTGDPIRKNDSTRGSEKMHKEKGINLLLFSSYIRTYTYKL